jgi:DNA-binding PadR family transcriptional regulator
MSPRDVVGSFEQAVLLSILRLGENAYGAQVKREIEERGARMCSLGALYTTLERLEAKGLVSSRTGEQTRQRGGRAKKYFKVEALGLVALRETLQSTFRMAEGLSDLIGGAHAH